MSQEPQISDLAAAVKSAFFALINRHLMIDIETMATRADAAVLSIGAAVFDPFYSWSLDQLKERTFYATIDLEDNMRLGRKVSGSTIKWWLQQSTEARMALFEGNVGLLKACDELRRFIDHHKPTHVWANGPTFDIIIMKDAFETTRLTWPFHYANERCVRTAEDMAFPNGDDKPHIKVGDKHNALDDAIAQAIMIQYCYRRLGIAHDLPTTHAKTTQTNS